MQKPPQKSPPRILAIEPARLIPHPLHANRMAAPALRKLARALLRTGRYEPLIVRNHPARNGDFEILHGHHRLLALKRLGHSLADCLLWDLDDADALLFLATANRLAGRERAALRLRLVDNLLRAHPPGDLAQLLPESPRTLHSISTARQPPPPPAEVKSSQLPEAFTIFLTVAQKRQLIDALAATHSDAAEALMRWAAQAASARTADSTTPFFQGGSHE